MATFSTFSFSLADEDIPPVLNSADHISPCCYKAVADPDPGDWISINSSSASSSSPSSAQERPFCMEPDTIEEQDHDGHDVEAGEHDGRSGWPGSQSSLPPSSHIIHHHQHCDSFSVLSSWPGGGHGLGGAGGGGGRQLLNVTSVALDEWLAWRHHETNRSIFSAVLAMGSAEDEETLYDFLDRDEDHLLFNTLGRWLETAAAAFSMSK